MGESFAQRIQLAATAIGVRAADIARAVGVTRGAVTHWYSGRSEPDGRQLVAIARFLRCDPTWLAEGRGTERAAPQRADERSEVGGELARDMRGRRAQLLDRTAAAPALPGPLVSPAPDYADDALTATMDLRREAVELMRAWLALPEVERDQFKRKIETASLRWRRHVIDERLRHLAAPNGDPGAPETSAKPPPKLPNKRRRSKV